MKKVIFAILISMAQLLFGTNIFAKTVTVYGLEAMPFCGTVDKQVTGIAIEILNEATKYGAPSFVFDLNIPWKRAQYNLEKATANDLVAIIPFSRTEARERNFKWVAELIKTQYRFYSYGRISPIKSIDEIKDKRVGVVFGHAIISVLEKLGLQKIDSGAENADKNITKLIHNRFDTIADSDIICLYTWKKFGKDKNDLQVGPAIGDPTSVCIATGLNFPDDTAKNISDAIDLMRKNGSLQKIFDKWF